ncbi:MAG TPA: hypothetical protein PKD48_01735 [Sphingopyxis sp.]|nr:hypothetical protein [Sphingopyxis sp.]
MTGGLAQFTRVMAGIDDDTPLADRIHLLGEADEALSAAIDDYAARHRADMIAREQERARIMDRLGLSTFNHAAATVQAACRETK